MAECNHCTHFCMIGGFESCGKELWHELDEPCDEYKEYTQDDEYWSKYAYQENKEKEI